MTLGEYIEKHGGPAHKQVLAKQCGVRWATIHDIARGASRPQPETAQKIEEATGGAVSALELLGLVSPEPQESDSATPVSQESADSETAADSDTAAA